MDSSTETERVVRHWFEEVWSKHRIEAIDELLSPDCKAHGLVAGGGVLIGPEGFKSTFHLFTKAFPDVTITPDDIVVGGEMSATRFTCRGTHEGDDLGVPATQRSVEFPGMCFARVQNGRIVEAWNVVDFAEMQRQIGTSA